MTRCIAVLLAVALSLTACSGNVAETSSEGVAEAATVAPSTPPALEFLGDLIVAVASPVVATIDGDGGSIVLKDGSRVEVPKGAFDQPVEVTAHLAAIDFESVFGEPTFGHAYLVSTVEDVNPAIPVTIEVPRPAESLFAVHVVGGEIAPAMVAGDGTGRVEITHFSDQGFLIFEAFAQDQELLSERAREKADRIEDEQRSADATYLSGCIAAVVAIFGAQSSRQGGYDADLTVNVASSVCTVALVRRASPVGVDVSTDCVGDGIEFGLDFRQAVDACAEEAQGDRQDDQSGADNTTAEEDPTSSGDFPPAVVQTMWTGTFDIGRDDFVGASAREPGQITVTRIEGTDQFRLETRIVIDWAGDCNAADVHTYEGVGQLYEDQIYFNGTNTFAPSSDCIELFGSEQESVRAVYFDEQGLIGTAGTFGDFLLPGEIPQPIEG